MYAPSQRQGARMDGETPVITQPYTLLSHIWLRRTPDGRYHAEDLWQIDLQAHFAYIADLRICCPVIDCAEAGPGWTAVEGLTDARVTRLPAIRGWRAAILKQPETFRAVRRAVSTSAVVHSGGAGWPFPPSYYLLLLRRRYRFRWFMVVESTPWMTRPAARRSLRQAIAAALHGRLVRRCVRSADMRLFTQDWYREHFLGSTEASLVSPAIWVRDDQLRQGLDAADRTLFGQTPLRLLFAGRLTPDKDPETFLDALDRLETLLAHGEGPAVEATIMGDGPLLQACRARAAQPRSRVRLRIAPPVDYGAPFFETVRAHHAVVLCNRGAEQPRLIYDAFSQGRPVFAAETTGTRAAVTDSGAGALFEAGNADSLAELIARHAADPETLAAMAERAITHATGKTHSAMHARRARFLVHHLAAGAGAA